MSTSSLADSVPLKNNIKRQIKIKQLIDYIVNELKGLQLNKLDPALCEHLCNLIENFVKKKYKIDKSDLLIQIYKALFPSNNGITDADITQIKLIVQHLLDSKLIQKMPFIKTVANYVLKVAKSKICL